MVGGLAKGDIEGEGIVPQRGKQSRGKRGVTKTNVSLQAVCHRRGQGGKVGRKERQKKEEKPIQT